MGFGLNQVNNLEKQNHSGLGEPGCDTVGAWGDSKSTFWCSDRDLSFVFVNLWCERRLRRVLLRRSHSGSSRVFLPKGYGGSAFSKRARWVTWLCGRFVSVVCVCNRSLELRDLSSMAALPPLRYCSLLVPSSSLAGRGGYSSVRMIDQVLMFAILACLSLSQFWSVAFGLRSGVAVSRVETGLWLALEVFRKLFLVEPDHKERIIGEANITGFCLSV
ncbi:hypothetical protein DY000_02063950 [Brassica cretica]|uniref:Uncharacterized protein n=1 Tax=Brassica cretica TaxID=69181 RepID=A0ABQ7AZC5_BRACR|nr:hypothetical protein DY000_02063950 [Brassica cretica]